MSWFFAILIVLAMGGVAAVASGRGGSLGQAYDDRADVRLPADRPVSGDDLRGLRFNTVLRGYRPSEVDALLDRLAEQLDGQRDEPQDGLQDGLRDGLQDGLRDGDPAPRDSDDTPDPD